MLTTPSAGTRFIENHERTINDALLHIACRPHHTYMHLSRDGLIDILEEIADLRFGEDRTTRACGFYSGPLFWNVFGIGGEVHTDNVAYRMTRQRHKANNIWIDRDVVSVTDALRQFHTDFARGCEDARMNRITISQLLRAFEAAATNVTITHHPGPDPAT